MKTSPTPKKFIFRAESRKDLEVYSSISRSLPIFMQLKQPWIEYTHDHSTCCYVCLEKHQKCLIWNLLLHYNKTKLIIWFFGFRYLLINNAASVKYKRKYHSRHCGGAPYDHVNPAYVTILHTTYVALLPT